MDPRLLEYLRCPVSKQHLDLVEIETTEVNGRKLLRTGILTCTASRLWYPIHEFVPVMLTFPTLLSEAFKRHHAAALAELVDFAAPALAPMPGETSVQHTFTEEWSALGDDELTFLYTDDELVALHRDVWLRMPDDERAAKRSVLNVGCGFGKEALILAKLFPNADILAVDLNLSLFAAAPHLQREPRMHPVVASLFRLPFADGYADHVHSQGVIHHTFSTKLAFDSIAACVAPKGSLFVWVYAAEDAYVVPGFRGFLVWLYWFVSHRLGRPVLSRAPAPVRNAAIHVLSLLMHPLVKWRSRHRGLWKYSNTLHGLRDAFTPRYAHQLGFNEVQIWFEDAGFAVTPQSPARYRDLFGKRLLGVGYVGRRGA